MALADRGESFLCQMDLLVEGAFSPLTIYTVRPGSSWLPINVRCYMVMV
jgi:hypothetical protein